MSIRTNELQQVSSVLGTDSYVVDTAGDGTARLTLDGAAEYYRDRKSTRLNSSH